MLKEETGDSSKTDALKEETSNMEETTYNSKDETGESSDNSKTKTKVLKNDVLTWRRLPTIVRMRRGIVVTIVRPRPRC